MTTAIATRAHLLTLPEVEAVMIGKLAGFASTDKARPALLGVHFDTVNGYAVATDSYRMAWVRSEAIGELRVSPFTAPAAAVRHLVKGRKRREHAMAYDAEMGTVTVSGDGGRIGAETFETVRGDGRRFPSWWQLVPEHEGASIHFSPGALPAIRAAAAISEGLHRGLALLGGHKGETQGLAGVGKLSPGPDRGLVVEVPGAERAGGSGEASFSGGGATFTLSGKRDGNPYRGASPVVEVETGELPASWGVNLNYLASALDFFGGFARMFVRDALKPMFLTDAAASDRCGVLVMPVRL